MPESCLLTLLPHILQQRPYRFLEVSSFSLAQKAFSIFVLPVVVTNWPNWNVAAARGKKYLGESMDMAIGSTAFHELELAVGVIGTQRNRVNFLNFVSSLILYWLSHCKLHRQYDVTFMVLSRSLTYQCFSDYTGIYCKCQFKMVQYAYTESCVNSPLRINCRGKDFSTWCSTLICKGTEFWYCIKLK